MPLILASDPLTQALKAPHFLVSPTINISGEIPGGFLGFEELTDRLTAFSISNSINDATGSALFTFARGRGTDSLSPLVNASVHRLSGGRPILDPNCIVRLNLDIRNGSGALIGTLLPMWSGRIDRVNVAASGTTVSIQCRDRGATYLNRMISRAISISGGPIEGVMASIMHLNGFNGVVGSDLIVPVSPGYQVTAYYTGEISVLESLRILAQQIGWDVRWFDGNPEGLRFYDPGRGRLGNDDTLGPENYSALTELSFGDEDVRNSWDVFYPDAVAPAQAEDAASIARYGLRYARIGEDRALNIRTLEAAQRLADAALADTKDPFASHEIRMPLYPVVQLNDLHLYLGNHLDAAGAHLIDEYDSDLMLAVVGYRHDWKAGPGMPTTTIQARGQPIAAYRDYRKTVEPKVIISGHPPDPTRYAPENTVWEEVPGLVL